MTFCPSCGKEVSPEWNVCTNCGQSLKTMARPYPPGGTQNIGENSMKHPFLLGSTTAAVLGIFALVLLFRNGNSYQSPAEALLAHIFVFGYFPITLIASPVIAAILAQVNYGNTRGMWSYFGGSAMVGFFFSVIIVLLLIAGAILS